jgi:hypothetical protein
VRTDAALLASKLGFQEVVSRKNASPPTNVSSCYSEKVDL